MENALVTADGTASSMTIWVVLRRAIAFGLDVLILELLALILAVVGGDWLAPLDTWAGLLGCALAIGYFGLLNSRWGQGQTLGQRLTRVKVVTRHGQWLGLGRSLARATLLSLIVFPFVAQQLAYLVYQGVLRRWYPLSPAPFVAQFGVEALQIAALYLVIFNWKTRQTLHDWLGQSYVVGAAAPAALNLPRSWRWNWLIGLGLGLALTFSQPPGMTQFYSGDFFPELTPLVTEVKAIDGVLGASGSTQAVTVNGQRQGRNLRLRLLLGRFPSEPEALAARVAALTLPYNTAEAPLASLSVQLTQGFDLGLAEQQQQASYAYCWVGSRWQLNQDFQEPRTLKTPHLAQLTLDSQGNLQSWSLEPEPEEQSNGWLYQALGQKTCPGVTPAQ